MSKCYSCGGSGRTTVVNSSGLPQFGGMCPSCGGSGLGPYSPKTSTTRRGTNNSGKYGARKSKRVKTPEEEENSFRWMMGFIAGGIILYNTNDSLRASADANPDSNAYLISVAVILIGSGLVSRFVPMVARLIAWGVAIAVVAFIYRAIKTD